MFVFLICLISCQKTDRISNIRYNHNIMFWNVENFFDYKEAEIEDKDFLPQGKRHWTAKRFYKKCNDIAKTILWVAASYNLLPDIVAFAEIENSFVLKSLLSSTLLRKLDYSVIHYDSPDKRGVDIGLIYQKSKWKYIESKSFHIYDNKGKLLKTRDILFVHLEDKKGESYSMFFCHLPSKFGGKSSDYPRKMAVKRLCDLRDSMQFVGHKNILMMGDFNENANSVLFNNLEDNNLLNLSKLKNKEGSIKYKGKWELIDLCFISQNILNKSSLEIVRPSFLSEKDTKYYGIKPFRTYRYIYYNGGVSDHYPILLSLR